MTRCLKLLKECVMFIVVVVVYGSKSSLMSDPQAHLSSTASTGRNITLKLPFWRGTASLILKKSQNISRVTIRNLKGINSWLKSKYISLVFVIFLCSKKQIKCFLVFKSPLFCLPKRVDEKQVSTSNWICLHPKHAPLCFLGQSCIVK